MFVKRIFSCFHLSILQFLISLSLFILVQRYFIFLLWAYKYYYKYVYYIIHLIITPRPELCYRKRTSSRFPRRVFVRKIDTGLRRREGKEGTARGSSHKGGTYPRENFFHGLDVARGGANRQERRGEESAARWCGRGWSLGKRRNK